MGNVLFIRVSAVTYDEAAMRKEWPGLYALCFSGDRDWGFGPGEKNVMELIMALDTGVRYSDMAKDQVAILKNHTPGLVQLKLALDMALGDHDVPTAKKLVNDIELALTNADKALGHTWKK